LAAADSRELDTAVEPSDPRVATMEPKVAGLEADPDIWVDSGRNLELLEVKDLATMEATASVLVAMELAATVLEAMELVAMALEAMALGVEEKVVQSMLKVYF